MVTLLPAARGLALALEKGQSDTYFPWSGITQAGTVCASGGTGAFKRLRDILAAGQPMVMLHNTGGVTQAFASLARALSKRDRDAARAVRSAMYLTHTGHGHDPVSCVR